MPVEQEKALKSVAAKKGFGKERTNAFVYGTLRRLGWKPAREQNTSPETPRK